MPADFCLDDMLLKAGWDMLMNLDPGSAQNSQTYIACMLSGAYGFHAKLGEVLHDHGFGTDVKGEVSLVVVRGPL